MLAVHERIDTAANYYKLARLAAARCLLSTMVLLAAASVHAFPELAFDEANQSGKKAHQGD